MAKVTSRREYEPSAPTLYLAFELGASQWKLGFSAGLGSTPLLRTVKAGDILAVSQEIARAKKRLANGHLTIPKDQIWVSGERSALFSGVTM